MRVRRYDVLHRGTGLQQRYVSGSSGVRNLYFPGRCSRSGESAVKALGLDDVVFEYEITSNRVDCYSVLGIAREAAATFRKKFCPPAVTLTGNDEDVNDYVKVNVKETGRFARVTAQES